MIVSFNSLRPNSCLYLPRGAMPLAKEYGRSWQSLGAELRSKGVNPFSPNGEIYGSLFLRSDVAKSIR
jgi:hypothetical protein